MAEQQQAAAPPPGVQPLFLRGVTCEKFGLKTGEGVNDVKDYELLPKEDVMKEIQVMGVMSDFEPAKKVIESYPGEQLLIVTDKDQKYGETFLICYTEEAKEEYMKQITEAQEALKAQLAAELAAEEERKAAEEARLNVVYEDKPISPRPWVSADEAGGTTESEISLMHNVATRDLVSIAINRPKRLTKQSYNFLDRDADSGGVAEFRAYKDPNFKAVRESDMGIQVAPVCRDSDSQTTWFRSVNKAVQYESASIGTDPMENDTEVDRFLSFLEKATIQTEQALQQNESVDIFHETFRLLGDDEFNEGVQADNELRELKNFADPNYSKFKALAAIDWVPKAQGLVAVSAVRNISFDQRVPIVGQTHTSYVLLWDFRLLVKPLILLQSHHEIFTFRFNRIDPNLVAGGCITGQVVLWEISTAMAAALSKNSRGSGSAQKDPDEDDIASLPVIPKFVSNVDHSHKKCVSDLFWLPPNTQINYRGQIVGEEHLDGKSYQFVTVAGDGMIMVWDIRYEQIFLDELRHIGRAKHIPTEKSKDNKDYMFGGLKPLWGPIFKAHLKRLEGVGELSLCKVCPTANLNSGETSVLGKPSPFPGDSRSQFIIGTEEGDVIFTDVSARAGQPKEAAAGAAGGGGAAAGGGEEEEDDSEQSCVKWINVDHPRPSVCMQESPFFPQITLSVSDWGFHIWKLGEDKPLFVSPLSNTYLTAGAWSNTRPAVLYIACADGQILVWDFTDSSFRPSIELKATHSKITSMEFLNNTATSSRYQLLAVGDDLGTLHIFEVPRNLTRPVHKEEAIMQKFLERELQRLEEPVEAAELPAEDSEVDVGTRVGTAADATGGATGGLDGAGVAGGGGGTAEPVMSAEEAALLKEEEEFLKLESVFISELGLTSEQLPAFIETGEELRPVSAAN